MCNYFYVWVTQSKYVQLILSLCDTNIITIMKAILSRHVELGIFWAISLLRKNLHKHQILHTYTNNLIFIFIIIHYWKQWSWKILFLKQKIWQ